MRLDKLQKKDYGKAIDFAVKGMHFDWYLNDGLLLELYGRYFLYMELCRATQVIAAYEGDTLTGVLLADFRGEKKVPFGKIFTLIFSARFKAFLLKGAWTFTTKPIRKCLRNIPKKTFSTAK